MEPENSVSADALSVGLDRIAPHVERADAWAKERFRLFPNLASVTVNFGFAFGLQVNMALTWTRSNQES